MYLISFRIFLFIRPASPTALLIGLAAFRATTGPEQFYRADPQGFAASLRAVQTTPYAFVTFSTDSALNSASTAAVPCTSPNRKSANLIRAISR